MSRSCVVNSASTECFVHSKLAMKSFPEYITLRIFHSLETLPPLSLPFLPLLHSALPAFKPLNSIISNTSHRSRL